MGRYISPHGAKQDAAVWVLEPRAPPLGDVLRRLLASFYARVASDVDMCRDGRGWAYPEVGFFFFPTLRSWWISCSEED